MSYLLWPKRRPLFGSDQRLERRVLDVAEQVIGFDVVITGVHVAVVLERERTAAGRRHDAEVVLPEPTAESDIEGRHIHVADVALHPFIEDTDQELSELLGFHGASLDQAPFLLVKRTVRAA